MRGGWGLVAISICTFLFTQLSCVNFSYAYVRPECVQLLTAQMDLKNNPLRETPMGKLAYEEVTKLTRVPVNSFKALMSEFTQPKRSARDLINYIVSDRKRVVDGLKRIEMLLPLGSVYRQIISHSLISINNEAMKNREDKSVIASLLLRLGGRSIRDLESRDSELAEETIRFASAYFGQSYGFMSEIQTALEVKGFNTMGSSFLDFLPETVREKLVRKAKAARLDFVLNFEHDITSYDPIMQRFAIIDIKNVGTRITSADHRTIRKYQERLQNLREFIALIKNDPELNGKIPFEIDFYLMIRNGGIDGRVADQLWHEQKIRAIDRSLDTFNAAFGT